MLTDLFDYLRNNEYPGRGIAVAKPADGKNIFAMYFIMGRSVNSRNRIFRMLEDRDGIETVAKDPEKLTDPHLIIYNPVLTFGKKSIITNGDQTDTIYDFLSEGKTFEDALRSRTFEDDSPNFTPRISSIINEDGSYKLSILKSADGNGESVERQFFDYPEPVSGEGHFISTYLHNGNPIPSFTGEPKRFACPDSIEDFMTRLWDSLNNDNRVSLFARSIELESGIMNDFIINK